MVISNRFGFVFLRIPKNASTSLATFFVKNCCDSKDRYTGIGDSGIRTSNISDNIIQKYKHQHRFIHLTLEEVIQEGILEPEELDTKKVIGVIRNPLERQLSLFFFKNRRKPTNTPKDFQRQFKNGYHHDDGSNEILQTTYPKYKGVQYGTFWKYPDLDFHLYKFIEEKNIYIKEPIKQFKSQYKKNKDTEKLIKEYYDDYTRKVVEEYYKEDFEVYESI